MALAFLAISIFGYSGTSILSYLVTYRFSNFLLLLHSNSWVLSDAKLESWILGHLDTHILSDVDALVFRHLKMCTVMLRCSDAWECGF